MKSFHASPSLRSALMFVAVGLLFWSAGARAQSLLVDEVHTLATPDQAVPIERSFSVTDAGTYQVQLTDVGASQNPAAPLASVGLAITSGSTVLGTPLTAAGKTQFTATAGATYIVRIVGKPGSNAGSGPVLVTITNTSTNTVLTGFEDVLALPPSAASNVGTVNDTFTVSTAGQYTVTLKDWAFPQPLAAVELALASPTALLTPLNLVNGVGNGSGSAPLQPNTTYTLFAVGQAASTATAGLYTAVVQDPSGNVVYSRTMPIGALSPLGKIALTGGTLYTLSFTDLSVPAALSTSGSNGVIATLDAQDGEPLTYSGTPGSRSFTALGGTYNVFGLATATTSPGGGSYSVSITPGGAGTPAPVFSVAQAVTTSGSTLHAYSYNANVTTAGTYTLQLTDYQSPQALTSVSSVAVQNGTSLAAPLSAAGSATLTAATGSLSVLVFAQPPTSSGAVGGVFGLFVTPAAGGAPLIEGTQGVGSSSSIVFASRKAAVTAAGSYVAQVTDVGFPTTFANFNVLVTQGTTVVGSFVNGGSLPITATAAADYFVTFTAQPALPPASGANATNSYKAGTYAIEVGPAPSVNLSSNPTHVASGGSVTLNWSSENASSCTATGGWSGAQATNGSATEGPLAANATYTLSCTGLGNTVNQSVTVTIDQSSGSGGGGGGHGGGSFDLTSLAALGGLLLLRATVRRRRA